MSEKQRLSVSVDPEVVDGGRQAVEAGEAGSLSAWVNAALHRQIENDRRLRALDTMIKEYEAEHGEITQAEMDDAVRWARARAIVVPRDGQGAA